MKINFNDNKHRDENRHYIDNNHCGDSQSDFIDNKHCGDSQSNLNSNNHCRDSQSDFARKNLSINQNLKIISYPSSENPFIVFYKPKGLPTAPTKENPHCALNLLIEQFPEIKNVVGKKECEYGLIHRIDTPTSGLVLVSTTQSCYDYFINEQINNRIKKTYIATCEYIKDNCKKLSGFPLLTEKIKRDLSSEMTMKPTLLADYMTTDSSMSSKSSMLTMPSQIATSVNFVNLTLTSYFRFYEKGRKVVRPVTENDTAAALKKKSNKLYTTNIRLDFIEGHESKVAGVKNVNINNNNADVYANKNNFVEKKILAKCEITNGFRHQVRCHLAWLGFPIVNDNLYNSNCFDLDNVSNTDLHFTANSIEFIHPVSGEWVKFEV